jgi:2-oxoglutarate ferredoxin oxidoreductase subunit alpha
MDDLIIGMAGAGGDGIVSAGESLIGAAAHEGYYAILTKSFGSQIRGGESSCRLRLATTPVLNPGGVLNVAVVLNWEDFLRFGGELPVDENTVVIHEAKCGGPAGRLGSVTPVLTLAVPMEQMALKSAGALLAKNNVVLGLLAGWFGLAQDSILAGIRKKFASKGEAVLQSNERAYAAGLEYAAQNPIDPKYRLGLAVVEPGRARRVVTDGNALCAQAALFAGCRFFGGYPITPATEIMQHLQRDIWKHGGSLLQAEDEIAGIGAAVGASFAGVKAMTATSGPGFSLKAEMLGLASVTELPLVCVNVQRGGPSTGMPTKREQSDLFAAVFSAHGDSVRPVLAPISVADTFGITVEAFNIAEEYQTPVILLSDQELAQRKEVIAPIDPAGMRVVDRLAPSAAELEHYTRFQFTPSGISPLSHPGMKGGNYLAAGIEHDEHGAPTASGEPDRRLRRRPRLRLRHPTRKRRISRQSVEFDLTLRSRELEFRWESLVMKFLG